MKKPQRRGTEALGTTTLLSTGQGRLKLARLQRFIAVIDLLPVHHVPPRRQILRAAIVVLQVVRVLPYVVAENREQSLRNRVVLVRSSNDLHAAVGLACQPDPARAELFGAGIV